MKSQFIDKKSIGDKISEFINDSRSIIDNKMKLILKLLLSIKEENEQIILKCK